MHITKVKINDYKSYLDTPRIKFEKGINLIIGKNNSGKTALLEALEGKIHENLHLNKNRKRRKKTIIESKRFQIITEITFDKDEILEFLEDGGRKKIIYFMNRASNSEFYHYEEPQEGLPKMWWSSFEVEEYDGEETFKKLEFQPEGAGNIISFFERLMQDGLKIQYAQPSKHSAISNFYNKKPVPLSGDIECIGISYETEKTKLTLSKIPAKNEICNSLMNSSIADRIFKFDIHRTVSNLSNGGSRLYPNCSNFGAVLDDMQSDRRKFGNYVNLVQEVFSDIKDISIKKEGGSIQDILIWMPQSTRDDLAIPLRNCGTGIGQVMVMLYLLVSSDESQIIIIDEPNSFLHPSAARKLIEIFNRHPQHQYIISTHSPEIISAAESKNILLLRINEQGQTEVQTINRKSQADLQTILNEVGSKLSDVFGYDKILWVEGETEEKCFPKIIQKLLGKSTVNIPVLKVHHAGQFEKKHIETSIYIYERLINGGGLMPPPLAFIFDKEGRSEQQLTDLKKRGKELIHFLGRRLYENYLLDEDAIVAVLKYNHRTCLKLKERFNMTKKEEGFINLN